MSADIIYYDIYIWLARSKRRILDETRIRDEEEEERTNEKQKVYGTRR